MLHRFLCLQIATQAKRVFYISLGFKIFHQSTNWKLEKRRRRKTIRERERERNVQGNGKNVVSPLPASVLC